MGGARSQHRPVLQVCTEFADLYVEPCYLVTPRDFYVDAALLVEQ